MSRTALAVLLTTFMAAPGGQSVSPDDDDYAGMVLGVVTDAETQNPVGGAQVSFAALDIGSVTRSDGNYAIHELPEEGRYLMTLQHPCYLTVSVEVELSQAHEQPLLVHVGLPLKPWDTRVQFSPPLGGCRQRE